MREAAHQFFETAGAGDESAQVCDFASGEFLPARADGRGFTNATKEDADFLKRETHFARKTNEENAIQGFRGIAALTACTGWHGKKADFLVITNGGSVEAGLPCESTDFHRVVTEEN